MATIRKGRHAGEVVRIHQFCNDWFSVISETSTDIVSPTNIKLDVAEMAMVLAAKDEGQTGQMFVQFELQDDGTFKRLGPPRRRR